MNNGGIMNFGPALNGFTRQHLLDLIIQNELHFNNGDLLDFTMMEDVNDNFIIQRNGTTIFTLTPTGNLTISGTFTVGSLIIDRIQDADNTTSIALTDTAETIQFTTNSIERASITSAGLFTVDGNINTGGSLLVGGVFTLNRTTGLNIGSGAVIVINSTTALTETTLGTSVVNSSLTNVGTLTGLTVSAEIGSDGIDVTNGNDYQISNVSVLSATTLGSAVVNSSLTNVGTLTGLTVSAEISSQGIDVTTGTDYQINNVSVLSATTLGTTVVNSSLTSLGTQAETLVMGTNAISGVTTLTAVDLIGTTSVDTSGSFTVSSVFVLNGSQLQLSGGQVLTSTTLGTTVVNSSLTNVGTLTGLTMGGTLGMGSNDITGTGSITSTDYTGTLQTAAQTNITSLGTLTGLTVSAEISSQGIDITTGTDYQINNVSVLSATTLGSSVVGSSLTSVGTLTTLAVTGNLVVNTDVLFVDTSANEVGINNATPSASLDVIGNARFGEETTGQLLITGGGLSATSIGIQHATLAANGSNWAIRLGNTGLTEFNSISNDMIFKINDAEKMRLASNGAGTDTIISLSGSDGTYINFGGNGRGIGVFEGGDLFMGYNLGYDATNNSYEKIETDESCGIEFNITGDIEFLVDASQSAGTEFVPTTAMTITNAGNVNATGEYQISGTSVLSSTTLGSGITSSSLTSVGTLSTLNINNSGATMLTLTSGKFASSNAYIKFADAGTGNTRTSLGTYQRSVKVLYDGTTYWLPMYS